MKMIIASLTALVFMFILCGELTAQPEQSPRGMKVSTSAFRNNKMMPSKYTRFGSNVSPPLTIANIPAGTESLALIVDDPDAGSKTWTHWVMFNMPVVESMREKTAPGIQGINDFGNINYDGPQPPSGAHRYFFTVYALDKTLDLEEGSTKEAVLEAMKGSILEKGRVVGLYARKVSDKHTEGHF